MPTSILLRVNTPCSQIWEDMTPGSTGPALAPALTPALTPAPALVPAPAATSTKLATLAPTASAPASAPSRFCTSCQKAVVDFTAMSDREILTWFSKHDGSTCGRFETSQLNRELSNPPHRQTWWRRRWNYLLAGLLLSSEVNAQHIPATAPTSRYDTSNHGRPNPSVIEELVFPPANILPDTIRGQVLDADNHKPVPFATITYSSNHGVQADAEGKFVLPTEKLGNNYMLTISSVGYQPQTVDVGKSAFSSAASNLIIPMLVTKTSVGDVVVVVGGYSVAKRSKRAAAILKDTAAILRDTAAIMRDTLATVGIGDKALAVYPNPVNRGSSINLGLRLEHPDTYTLQLFNITGALIETMEVAGDQRSKDVLMNIPATLTPGNYFVRLSRKTKNNIQTRQLVIL